jgi:ABC-type multidrug transport system permease subunit
VNSSGWPARLRCAAAIFGSSAVIAYRSSNLTATRSTLIVRLAAIPAAELLFLLTMASTEPRADFLAAALAAAATGGTLAGLGGGSSVHLADRNAGTLPYTLLGTAPRLARLCGKVALSSLLGVMTALIGLLLVAVFLRADLHPDILALMLPVLVASTLSGSCLGIALTELGLRLRDPYLLPNLAMTLLLLLCGIVAPVRSLPFGLNLISLILPLTHAAQAARDLAAGLPGPVAGELGLEFLLAAAWLAVGLAAGQLSAASAIRAGNFQQL